MKDRLDALVKDVGGRVIEWRRHLHANPELSFQEFRTAAFIVETLESFGGIEISRPSGTSVIAASREAV